jgi:hypothetical protein
MLPFIMIVASPTQISLPLLRARRLPLPGRGIGVHPERLGAFSSLLSSSNISTFKPSNPQTVPSPSPFPATLTTRVKHKPFPCHSYKKHPGWGAATFNSFVAQTSVCALLRQSTSEIPEAKELQELKNLAVLPVSSHESPVAAQALSSTSHQSQITKSCKIRTFEKHTRNPFGIGSFKTQDLKPFRMCSYKKTGGGGPSTSSHLGQAGYSLFSNHYSLFVRQLLTVDRNAAPSSTACKLCKT